MIESLPQYVAVVGAVVSVFGAAISVFLNWIKTREWWASRTHLSVTTITRGSEEVGHDILLINNSTTHVFVYSFDIVSANEKDNEASIVHSLFSLQDSFWLKKIEPRTAEILNFSEGNYFNEKPKKGRNYLRLWIVGRAEPLWLPI